MQRLLLPLTALVAAFVLPAFAQQAPASATPAAPTAGAPQQTQEQVLAAARKLYAETKISHDADMALYCGAGFHLIATMAAAAQNSEAPSFEKMSQTLLARADKLLTTEGLSFEQRSKLAEAVTVVANEQVIRADEAPRYSKDDCTAAVPATR